jgi:hypothetical protein
MMLQRAKMIRRGARVLVIHDLQRLRPLSGGDMEQLLSPIRGVKSCKYWFFGAPTIRGREGIEPPTRGFSAADGTYRGLSINHLQHLPAH